MADETRVRMTTKTTQSVHCAECGDLSQNHGLDLLIERDAFRVAYRHASMTAHEVVVTSTVTTKISGYVNA